MTVKVFLAIPGSRGQGLFDDEKECTGPVFGQFDRNKTGTRGETLLYVDNGLGAAFAALAGV